MTPSKERELLPRDAGDVEERAPVYGWARRTVYGGGGVAGRLARGVAAPLGWAWGASSARRMSRSGANSGRRLSVPAVSVGNVTLGGGGKTSLVEWIVRGGGPPGAKVAVLSRGFGRATAAPMALAPGRVEARVAEVGDEPALLARAGAWVGIGGDRFEAAFAVEALGGKPDLYVLDDGLQHLSVPRALDLVTFTVADLAAPARCVPAGPLRQRPSWRPPHAVWVVVDADPRDGEWPAGSIGRAYAAWWRELPGTSAAWEREGTVTLESWQAGGESPFEPESRPLVAFAGVARPESVADYARGAGFEIAALVAFPDHHPYTARDIVTLRSARPGAAFLTTEKDAVKCDPGWFGDAPAGVLRRRLRPGDPALLQREIEEAIAWRA
jgi:tetraacyldisaccharide 4'-kinase